MFNLPWTLACLYPLTFLADPLFWSRLIHKIIRSIGFISINKYQRKHKAEDLFKSLY